MKLLRISSVLSLSSFDVQKFLGLLRAEYIKPASERTSVSRFMGTNWNDAPESVFNIVEDIFDQLHKLNIKQDRTHELAVSLVDMLSKSGAPDSVVSEARKLSERHDTNIDIISRFVRDGDTLDLKNMWSLLKTDMDREAKRWKSIYDELEPTLMRVVYDSFHVSPNESTHY